MKALVTGASSGIGYEIAKYLDELNYELILVARDKDKLEQLQSKLKNKSKVVVMDLSLEANVKSLYVMCKNEDIDILVNNAGFGMAGYFTDNDLNRELEMIDLNIKSVHLLTKLFLKDMKKRDSGRILNVSSTAGFQSGPLMATYYGTKSYVYRLTEAIAYELKKQGSNVKVSVLCPGPVRTNFNRVAGINFTSGSLSSKYVARYAVDKMLKNKVLIISGTKMKLAKFFSRFLSDKAIMRIIYKYQSKKLK